MCDDVRPPTRVVPTTAAMIVPFQEGRAAIAAGLDLWDCILHPPLGRSGHMYIVRATFITVCWLIAAVPDEITCIFLAVVLGIYGTTGILIPARPHTRVISRYQRSYEEWSEKREAVLYNPGKPETRVRTTRGRSGIPPVIHESLSAIPAEVDLGRLLFHFAFLAGYLCRWPGLGRTEVAQCPHLRLGISLAKGRQDSPDRRI